MCDYKPGQLILAHDAGDEQGQRLVEDIRKGYIGHVEVLAELEERLKALQLESTLSLRLYLLSVPQGQELWKINYLHTYYRTLAPHPPTGGSGPGGTATGSPAGGGSPTTRGTPGAGGTTGDAATGAASAAAAGGAAAGESSGAHATPPISPHVFCVVPNSYLILDGFVPSSDHPSYKAMIGLFPGSTGAGVKVAVVDSGVEASMAAKVVKVTDVLMLPGPSGIDRLGHGTAVANIIRDVAPGASLEIVKITDTHELVEWDALAGIRVAFSADVINLSLSFGTGDQPCARCGRQSISSRSMVFEMVVGAALAQPHQPILVASAGNDSKTELRYPARFGDVVAIGAFDAEGKRASYSNYGARNAAGTPHANLFFAPGGEETRPVGSTTTPLAKAAYYGTSLATAYASGVIACARETRPRNRAVLLEGLRTAARKSDKHLAAEEGNGLIQRS